MKVIYILLSLFILSACSNISNQVEEDTSEKANSAEISLTSDQIEYANIKLGKLEKQKISESIKANGKINLPADGIVSITPMMSGFIAELNVLPGEHVKKGELLAKLQHRDFITLQQKFLEAKSELNFLEKEYTRQQTLVEQNAGSTKNFEKTESEYNALQAQYNSLKEQLKMLGLNPSNISPDNITNTIAIYSPVGGYISDSKANIGKYISAEEVIFDILCNKQMQIELEIFEKDILEIKENQEVVFTIPSNPEQYKAAVHLIGRMVNNETKTIPVYCRFSEHYKELRHGMKVTAEIITNKKEVHALPFQALVRNGDNYFGFVAVNDHTFIKKQLETGIQSMGYIEIKHAEKEMNNEFVISGANYLEAEMSKDE